MKKTRPLSPLRRISLSATLAGLFWLIIPVAHASPDHDRFDSCFGVRGEAARQLRRIYETQYRSRNVYRSSRHADPWQNPYRSSRHYQRELALSHDGYIVNTVFHGDQKLFHFNPGNYPRYPPSCGYAGCPFPPHLAHDHYDPVVQIEITPSQNPADSPLPQPSPPRKLAEKQPTQRPIMKQITLGDGQTKTIITSVPIGNNQKTPVAISSRHEDSE